MGEGKARLVVSRTRQRSRAFVAAGIFDFELQPGRRVLNRVLPARCSEALLCNFDGIIIPDKCVQSLMSF